MLIKNNLIAMKRNGNIKLTRADIDGLKKVKAIIAKDFKMHTTIVGLAQEVGINDYKLKKGFKELFDVTIYDYLYKVRMEKARELLDEPDISIKEIAKTVGYRSASSFIEAFKKMFGETPSSWRKSKV